jgi:hypothetical protein
MSDTNKNKHKKLIVLHTSEFFINKVEEKFGKFKMNFTMNEAMYEYCKVKFAKSSRLDHKSNNSLKSFLKTFFSKDKDKLKVQQRYYHLDKEMVEFLEKNFKKVRASWIANEALKYYLFNYDKIVESKKK